MGSFRFAVGSNFMYPEATGNQLQEGFITREGQIVAQVSVEHIEAVLKNYLILNQDKPLFFFMEVPLNLKEENAINGTNVIPPAALKKSHKQVYYLDGISVKTCFNILDSFEEILINDGISAFGFGTPESELGKYKYNEMALYCQSDELTFSEIFLKAGVPYIENLVLARELFSQENPGVATRYEDADGHNIYEVVEVLQEAGLYEVEIRDDD